MDHNVADTTIEATIVRNQTYYTTKVENGKLRYYYGEVFEDKETGEPFENVILSEQRTAGGGDSHELGVVTAFCEDAGGVEQSKCPSWVNEQNG